MKLLAAGLAALAFIPALDGLLVHSNLINQET
jgi:hypothetical protein